MSPVGNTTMGEVTVWWSREKGCSLRSYLLHRLWTLRVSLDLRWSCIQRIPVSELGHRREDGGKKRQDG